MGFTIGLKESAPSCLSLRLNLLLCLGLILAQKSTVLVRQDYTALQEENGNTLACVVVAFLSSRRIFTTSESTALQTVKLALNKSCTMDYLLLTILTLESLLKTWPFVLKIWEEVPNCILVAVAVVDTTLLLLLLQWLTLLLLQLQWLIQLQ